MRTFLFFGLIEAALGLGAFIVFYVHAGWRPFEDLDAYSSIALEASTLTFLGIVGGQVGCLFAQRDGSLRSRLSLRSNPLLGVGLAVEVAIAVALVYTPGLNGMFSMAPVGPAWLIAIPLCGLVMLLLDIARRGVVAVRGNA
jgi:magnesium-transporting ATPase (P-type)